MASREEILKEIERLSQQAVEAPDMLSPSRRNETWTKNAFVAPLLEKLGWVAYSDISFEDQDQPDTKGALDYILSCDPPIGIEAKKLAEKPPEDRTHPQRVS